MLGREGSFGEPMWPARNGPTMVHMDLYGTPSVPGIECRGLTKSYGSDRVLDGLDLAVWPGRVYALLGRNGAGKSTTFKALLGLLSPDRGVIRILGEQWRRDLLDQVGASVDGPAFYPQLSASENLMVHARLTGVRRGRVDQVLVAVGLSADERKPARRFSTGMRARLALAIALLTDPPVLMLDEPIMLKGYTRCLPSQRTAHSLAA